MPATKTPEELIDRDGEPLNLKLRCRACNRTSTERFEWAMVDPDPPKDRTVGDGVVLCRIVTCKQCGVVDDYELDPLATLGLVARGPLAGPGNRRVIYAKAALWDGTKLTRPTQGLAHLRTLCAARPDQAEAHGRLGNFCDRFGLFEEAVAAWTAAVELDPNEFEAAHSLAAWYLRQTDDGDKLLHYLSISVTAYSAVRTDDPTIKRFAPVLAEVLLEAAQCLPMELGLMAVWEEGQVGGSPVMSASDARLRPVRDPGPLVDFLQRDGFVQVRLSLEPSMDEPTRLQRLLAGDSASELRTIAPRNVPVRTGPKIGRNEPCPCGSGKKHKRCCGA